MTKPISDKRLNQLFSSYAYNMRIWNKGVAQGRPPKPCDMKCVDAKIRADKAALQITAEVSRRREQAIKDIQATPEAKKELAKQLTVLVF